MPRLRPLFVMSLFVLAAGLLPACGLRAPIAPARVARMPVLRAHDTAGAYLALCIAPTPELVKAAADLRAQLGFLDMGQALPPRDPQAFHVTVGYFQHLSDDASADLRKAFCGRSIDLAIAGYGVANNQAAYFTLGGDVVQDAREQLQGMKIAYDGDTPHVTFGVSPTNPRDVHGVPKAAGQPIGPFPLHAEFHLLQGPKQLW